MGGPSLATQGEIMEREYEKWIKRLDAERERQRKENAVTDWVGELGTYANVILHESKPDVSRCRKTCPARSGGTCDC